MITKYLGVAFLTLLLAGCASTGRADLTNPRVAEDGFYVRTFPDGSGSVAMSEDVSDSDWSIDCRIDPMNDRRSCNFYGPAKSETDNPNLYSSKGNIFVFYGYSAEPQSICISNHDFPYRTGAIRVDGNAPVTTDREGCVPAGKLLGQLKSGTKVVTRRVSWPYDYPIDTTYSLLGFNKATAVVQQLRAGPAK